MKTATTLGEKVSCVLRLSNWPTDLSASWNSHFWAANR